MRNSLMYAAAAVLIAAVLAVAGCPKPASDTTASDPAALVANEPPAETTDDGGAPAAEPGAETTDDAGAAATESPADNSEAKPIEWLDYDEGMKLAADEGRPVMIDLYADWCPPCKMLDEQTWPDPEVQKLAGQFVCIKVNVDENGEVGAKYEASSIPLIVFLKSDGTKIDSLVGFREAAAMAEAMQAALDKK